MREILCNDNGCVLQPQVKTDRLEAESHHSLVGGGPLNIESFSPEKPISLNSSVKKRKQSKPKKRPIKSKSVSGGGKKKKKSKKKSTTSKKSKNSKSKGKKTTKNKK